MAQSQIHRTGDQRLASVQLVSPQRFFSRLLHESGQGTQSSLGLGENPTLHIYNTVFLKILSLLAQEHSSYFCRSACD